MPRHHDPQRIVLHIAGIDRPGVTSTLSSIIAEDESQLVAIGQSVLHGYLMLSAIVDIPHRSPALRHILFAVSEMGLRLEVSAFREATDEQRQQERAALCLTLMGDAIADGKPLAHVTRFLADRQMNLVGIRTLTAHRLTGLELIAELPGDATFTKSAFEDLRGEILGLTRTLEVDMAVQKDDVYRRAKRLVCMDVDSTFAQGEFIDELADLAGCKGQVAEITARAMRGEIGFKEALRERVRLLKGLAFAKAKQLVERIPLTPGALDLVKTLKSLGFHVGLVSGGFDFFVDDLKERCGLDFAFANQLEIVDGKLSGEVRGTIVDAERKAQILRDMCQVYHCRPEQSVAVGDGANDIEMLQAAGLGIAFHGKPLLQSVADTSLNHHDRIDVLLFLMGFSEEQLRGLRHNP